MSAFWRSAAFFSVLSSLAIVSAQEPSSGPPTFHSEIDYVEFPVRVTDQLGNLVSGLAQSDFQIFEDGKPQVIATFALVELGTSSIPRSPRTRVAGASDLTHTNGQIYLFVLDDYHILPAEAPRARDVVGTFIRSRMTDDDRGAIAITSGGGLDLTGDREALIAALNSLRGRLQEEARSAEREIQARQTLKTIADASARLGDARGRRKILFLIGDEVGCAVGAFGPIPCGLSLLDAVTSARRADVSVYPLHTAGLNVPDCLKAQFAGGAPEGCGGATGRARGPLSPLSVLATETGGFMINDTNNLADAFDRVMRENSAYYLVGYYSNNGKHDGKFRKNEVMLTRKHLRVQYRPGYTAPRIH